MTRKPRGRWGCCLAPLLYLCFATSPGLAQETTAITATTGLGNLGTTVTSHGPTLQITGGTRPNNGTNLFHSFDQFSIGRPDTAQFLNTTASLPTSNILARVTGGTPSSIFGSIDTTSYPRANLFLMNPAGIVFGPHATLHVGGSVAFTTADYLRLAETTVPNAGMFHADTTAPGLLTSAPVAAFGFLNSHPTAIAVQGSTLTVQAGKSIALIGGNLGFSYLHPDTDASTPVSGGVSITGGHLVTAGGQVTLASLASAGVIRVEDLHQTGPVTGPQVPTFGPLQISEHSRIDTRGESGGLIHIRGGHLIIDSSRLTSTTGSIAMDAVSIQIAKTSEVTTETRTAANAGHISLNTQRDIALDSGALVMSSSKDSSGDAGNITVQSRQGNISLTTLSSVTTQSQRSGGNTGSIIIDAPHGDIHINDSFLYTSAQGAGMLRGIQITANNLFLHKSASIVGNNFTTQVAEPIQIMVHNRLHLTEGSVIETGTPGSADAADLVIRSREITLTDHSILSTITTGSGNAGRLSLFTDKLDLADGAQLLSSSLVDAISGKIPVGHGGAIRVEGFTTPGAAVRIAGGESGIFTDTQGSGTAGDISLKSTALMLQNGGAISAKTTGTNSTATGGSIMIQATDHVSLTNHASLTAESKGTAAGNAGDITLDAGQQLDVHNHSFITTATESRQANGGNIKIQAIDRVRFVNSTLSTSVQGTEGSGGNIFIDPQVVVIQGSAVTAQAVGGAGGTMTFVTPLFLADSASVVSASSQRGPSGTVTIQSPTSNLSGTVGQLTAKPSQPQVLLQSHCAAKSGNGLSTFLLTGRNSLPDEPGGWLNTPISVDHWMGEDSAQASGLMVRKSSLNKLPTMAKQLPNQTGLSLRHLTPPGFLVRTFATGSTDCRS